MFLLTKRFLFIIGVIFFVTVLFFFLSIRDSIPKPQNRELPPPPTIFSYPTEPKIKRAPYFLGIDAVPTLPAQEGGGVDTNSRVVIDSENEIKKIYPLLPYTKNYTLSTSARVSVVVPQKNPQDSPWALLVEIFGLDYQLRPGDENYQIMKSSFKEAANDVLSWLIEKGVNPNKVFIVWGDRAFIQNTATAWLKEP